MYAHLRNETPQIIAFIGKKPSLKEVINPRKIAKDGTYRLRVPLIATAPGGFRLVATYTSERHGCVVSCYGCEDGPVLCGDNGKVDCSGGACGRGCGSHSGGPACGAWSCDCSFNRCVCKK